MKSLCFQRDFNEKFHAFREISMTSFMLLERFKQKAFLLQQFLSQNFANARSLKAFVGFLVVPERLPSCATLGGAIID